MGKERRFMDVMEDMTGVDVGGGWIEMDGGC